MRSEDWRYIRYVNGDEELYHDSADPNEYLNLAGSPQHSEKKAELAKWLPRTDAPELPTTREGRDEGPKVAKKKKAKAKQ